ncbi:MAG: helix-turn-helix transcriptional regulator [Chloroflexi bacterium]|nr:helix-turn-helix transcriptional regulator [Chloroflexota bacterium]
MGRREKRVHSDGSPARTLGATLRRARQARDIALGAMSHRLSYSVGYVSAVETGAVWPSREFVEIYERALGLRPGELTQVADNLAPARRQPGATTPGNAEVGQLLARVRQGIGPATPSPVADRLYERGASAVRPGQTVVRGFEAALRWATELVEDAAGEPPHPGEPILFSSPTWADALDRHPDLAGRWWRALRAALEDGWDVVHVCRPDRDGARNLSLVTEMLALLGFAGHYQPYSLPLSISRVVPCDLLIVPGQGAMQFLTTGQDLAVDAACFFCDGELLKVLRDHVEGLRSRATPMLRIYQREVQLAHDLRPHPDLLRYAFAHTRTDALPGDRLMVKDGLRSVTLPSSVFLEWARRLRAIGGEEWTDWMRTLIENRLERIATFHDQLRELRFRDICSKRGIERLATAEQYAVDDRWLRVQIASGDGRHVGTDPLQVPATREERLKHLQAVVDLLKTYPNYELGLVDDPQATDLAEISWHLKGSEGEGTLFLDTWCPDGEHRAEMSLEISQRDVVEAFRAYFWSLWESLPAPNRDKQQVIAWLEGHIARVL